MPLFFVTPVVTDEKGRKVSRTMQPGDKLQDLMDFYYARVPVVPYGEGVFLYRGERVDGRRTPLNYDMVKNGDYQIEFFYEMKPSTFVTLTVTDVKEDAVVTRTMRRTERLQDLMDFYYAMAPYDFGTFFFNLKKISGDQTPMDLEMEGDEDQEIDFIPVLIG